MRLKSSKRGSASSLQNRVSPAKTSPEEGSLARILSAEPFLLSTGAIRFGPGGQNGTVPRTTLRCMMRRYLPIS